MPHVRRSCKAKHSEEVLEASSGWMDRVGVLIMELHENMTLGCKRNFRAATSGFDFGRRVGENLFAARKRCVPDALKKGARPLAA